MPNRFVGLSSRVKPDDSLYESAANRGICSSSEESIDSHTADPMITSPSVETARLILRHWRDSDREPFARMNADARVMQFFPAPLSGEESDLLVDKIEAHFQRHGFGPYAVELRTVHTFGGFVGLNVPSFDAPFTPCVEIGWRIVPELWGQGLATEGARAIVKNGFEVFGLAEIVSFTVPANLASRRVMEKLGMTHDASDDFDHPQIPEGHPLRRHVLYRLRKQSV